MTTECSKKKVACYSTVCGAIIFSILLILGWSIQGIQTSWQTLGCGPLMTRNYGYLKGGDTTWKNTTFDNKFNILPLDNGLTSPDNSKYMVDEWDTSTQQVGVVIGHWSRYSGIFWSTYVFDDENQKKTIYMRSKMLTMGSSHKIARCDGQHEDVTVSEGMDYFTNFFRRVFGYVQSDTFQVWVGDKLVATAQEMNDQSIDFKSSETGLTVATARLYKKDDWHISNQKETPIPAWATNAFTAMWAFKISRSSKTSPEAMDMRLV